MPQLTPEEIHLKLIKDATDKGWVIVTEGPSGTELKKKNSFSLFTAAFLILGVLLIPAFPIGGLGLLALAAINHVATKDRKKFIAKTPKTADAGDRNS